MFAIEVSEHCLHLFQCYFSLKIVKIWGLDRYSMFQWSPLILLIPWIPLVPPGQPFQYCKILVFLVENIEKFSFRPLQYVPFDIFSTKNSSNFDFFWYFESREIGPPRRIWLFGWHKLFCCLGKIDFMVRIWSKIWYRYLLNNFEEIFKNWSFLSEWNILWNIQNDKYQTDSVFHNRRMVWWK